MGIFDLLGDVKERVERQQKAKEYLRDAKKYVKDGKELYEKAYDKVMAYTRETNYLLERHSQYKKQKFEEFSHNIQPVLHDFRSFNIDNKIAAMQIDASTSSHFDFDHTSIVNIPTISVFDVIDFFSANEDYYEARQKRDEAKYYYQSMRCEKERLYSLKDNMYIIRQHIEEERRLLADFFEKLQTISKELTNSMNREAFSPDEAKMLSGICGIAEKIGRLLSAKFLDGNVSITEEYQKNFDQVKRINQSLQEIPNVTGGTAEWLREMSKHIVHIER